MQVLVERVNSVQIRLTLLKGEEKMEVSRLQRYVAAFLTIVVCVLFVGDEDAGAAILERIYVSNSFETDALLRMNLDIASYRAGEYIDVVTDPAQQMLLRTQGYVTATLIDDLQEHFNTKINYDGNMGDYHTYEEMLQVLNTVADRYPDITRLYNIGESWETIHKGAERYIWAMKISDEPDTEDDTEPDVFFVGVHHAREVITVEIPLYYINYMTENYGSDPEVTYMVDNREIWLVPMMNPDGHYCVQNENSMWRKNMNRNGSPFSFFWGVDPNRNYSYKWGYDDAGSSPFKFMETYRGTAPLSEPENQVIADFFEAHDFTISLSFHSYGELFLFPWSYDNLNTVDHDAFCEIGREATKYNHYTWGNPNMGVIYNCNGEMDDWVYGVHGGFGFTAEVGTSFWPPDSQIPTLCDENLYPMILLTKLAENPYLIFPYRIHLEPENTVVPKGGTLRFTASVQNESESAVDLQAWTTVMKGNFKAIDPSLGPRWIHLEGSEAVEFTLSEAVPENAPEGVFLYVGKIGFYPDNLRGKDSFLFTITE
jgi:hypothetical protein